MASRFVRQGHLGGFLPAVVPSLLGRPCRRVEGACSSGGLAIAEAWRALKSGEAQSVFVAGVEIQNSVKALYCADILAGAAWFRGMRKEGHAYFFPDLFSQRAGAYAARHGAESTRRGLARWYENAILNARTCPEAQEYHNKNPDLLATGLALPDPKVFLEHLTLSDCSKVSDGAASIALMTEEEAKRRGIDPAECLEILSFGGATGDITQAPPDLTRMSHSGIAARRALDTAGISPSQLAIAELHDCFSITGLLLLEAVGLCSDGQAPQSLEDGLGRTHGPRLNRSGGLIGYGHPTGATGVRQLVDLWKQLCDPTSKLSKPFGLMVSMGGNDISASAFVVKNAAD
jgi:acetyl-CoA C-acetyltransferase/acetyl-CoA acyltransferase